jgi:hypothetical protein
MSSTRPYRLAEHSHVCATSQGAIFLDLARDTYSGIDAHQAAALTSLVEGWPLETAPSTASMEECRTLADSLCERGLLTATDSTAAAARESDRARTAPPVTDELVAWDAMPRINIRLHHVLTFLRVLIRALWMLRCRSLHAVVLRRGAQNQIAGADAVHQQRALACELLSVYTLLRMFTFARRGRCLLDSIALVEFLAAYGVRADWVIGVHVRPFSAHSWVQHEHFVLNGSPAFVRHFQPILVT